MKQLNLGPQLQIPALEAQTNTFVVYGGRGMGKTTLASVWAEEFAHNGLKFSVIDPVGVWWGLAYSADGKGAGVEVLRIGGGRKPDIEIVPSKQAAEACADLVVEEDVSTIIDISRHVNGTMWTKGEKLRFVRDYCTRLYMRQGERRRPLMQLIDEAARFIPQQIPKGAEDVAACMGAIEDMVELGRNVGIGVGLITQRSARMNKSVSELCEMMVSFRTVGPNSIDAIIDWFGEHVPKVRQKELIEQIRSLAVGRALVVSPGWLELEGAFDIRIRTTFDSSATPKAGTDHRTTGRGAEVDREKYRTRMAEIEEQAEADNPKALQKQITLLKRDLATAEKALEQRTAPGKGPSEDPQLRRELAQLTKALEAAMKFIVQVNVQELGTDLSAGDQEALRKAIEAAVGKATGVLDGALEARRRQFDRLKRDGQRLLRDLEKLAGDDVTVQVDVKQQEPFVVEPAAQASKIRERVSRPESNGQVSGAQQRILDALAWLRGVGQEPARRAAVGLIAGYSHTSGGFNNLLGALRSSGYIDYPQTGSVVLTEAGVAVATPLDISGEREMREAVYKRVGNAKAKILRVLVEAHPEPISREDLGAATGYSHTSGGFNNLLGALRTVGLADYPQKGYVVATEALFL